MKATDIVAVGSPSRSSDRAVVAACRAGGRGLIGASHSLPEVLDRCAEVYRLTQAPFGLAVDELAGFPLWQFAGAVPSGMQWLLLPLPVAIEAEPALRLLHDQGVELIVEVNSAEEFAALIEFPLELSGIVLKGNEAGGRVSSTTAFVLCQQWRDCVNQHSKFAPLPFWVRGGMGPNAAAAVALAGARGVVLDAQLLLARESGLSNEVSTFLRAMDGGESVSVGASVGFECRILPPPGSSLAAELSDLEEGLMVAEITPAERCERMKQALLRARDELEGQWPVLFAGQDAALAGWLGERYITVAGIMQGLAQTAAQNIELSAVQRVLVEGGPLALSHGTRYPILQGPMTRVSDVSAFAAAVAAQGALPFLALALLRENEAATLLAECRQRISEQPWGVGLLGFLPPEIRQEQVRAIKQCKPTFAIIAGGRPDQAKELEDEGITTYLHVPSPGLLGMFVRQGARRFILEGRECGGHVGPRSSFVLWEQQIQVILRSITTSTGGSDIHLVFAGGIHDALSASMVAAMAAPLVARGVKIGVLMGTAYLFTHEAVDTGAIVPKFQQEALDATNTVLFETGPGHAIRCLQTPYFQDFNAEKRRLKGAGKSHRDIVIELERRNTGRLRMASKGVDRRIVAEGTPRALVEIPETEQYAQGMYMIGQVASLHRKIISIEHLHQTVTHDAQRLLEQAAQPTLNTQVIHPHPCDVAIVGMSCFYPGAKSLREYWDNIQRREYHITEIPETHWDWRIFYDENPRARDKIVSKWGGFLGDISFDPLQYGITPASIKSIEPLQLLLLECVNRAVHDAGYDHRPFDRENTCAILGIGGGGSPMAVWYGFRACLPLLNSVDNLPIRPEEIVASCDDLLPNWTEDSFPGILMNVAVGRVANRFDFGGSNYAIDAACASSLAAVHACIRELEQGTANVAFAIGADTVQTPYAYMAFSKTHALSPRGRCRPFDANADGIVLSEGIGTVVLKRLADAERDGDKIYAVIRGVGSSSDGKDKGLTAPNSAGQIRALHRAYSKAGMSPSRVGLVEAHGTGTVVGDRTELEALARVMEENHAAPQSCALGSVKSMIGHSKCAAGVAGLIKATMALHHRVLPPTLVESPNQTVNFSESPLYLNTQTRPWVNDRPEPRSAGVSAFGFGGTNVHVVLEEYRDQLWMDSTASLARFPTELFVLRSTTVADVTQAIDRLHAFVSVDGRVPLAEMAAALWRQSAGVCGPMLCLVAESHQQLSEQLQIAKTMVASSEVTMIDPRGIYWTRDPASRAGKVAMLFPGQGSQYPNMLADVACSFPCVRQALDAFSLATAGAWERPLARMIYPPSPFTDDQAESNRASLARTDVAQPAIGATSVGMFELLRILKIVPDVCAGHSFGEFTALWAAGVIDGADLVRLALRRGQVMREAAGDNLGGMIAAAADEPTVTQCLADVPDVIMANLNAPDQTVVSGPHAALDDAMRRLQDVDIKVQRLQVSCAFHSPQVATAESDFADDLMQAGFANPRCPVYSNQTAAPHSTLGSSIRELLLRQMTSPVRFRDEIEAMYTAGVRTFIEVGPQGQLTGLVKRNLGSRPHVAVATDISGRNGLVQLQHALAQLMLAGVPIDLTSWFDGRIEHRTTLMEIGKAFRSDPAPMTWMVNGIRSRLWDAAEPRLLGQRIEVRQDSNQGTAVPIVLPAASSPANPRISNSMPMKPQDDTPLIRPTSSHVAQQAPASVSPSEIITPATSPSLSGGTDPVMIGFQELMSQFLDAQRDIMLEYLRGGSDAEFPRVAQHLATAIPPASPKPSTGANATETPSSHNHQEYPVGEKPAKLGGHSANGELDPVRALAPSPPAPVADTSVSTTASVSKVPSVDSIETITERLLSIVGQRTGYPREMLNLDLDLEADLGIDSIKRVEILGELAEELNLTDQDGGDSLELEKLTAKRSLRGMLDYLKETLFTQPGEARGKKPAAAVTNVVLNADTTSTQQNGKQHSAKEEVDSAVIGQSRFARHGAVPSSGNASTEVDTRTIQRGKIQLVDVALPGESTPIIPSGAVLITDDCRGLAVEVADRLADFGQTVVLVRHGEVDEPCETSGIYVCDLTSQEHVNQLVDLVHQKCGRVAGLIHLLPLATVDTAESWTATAWLVTKSLYLLCQAWEQDLQESAEGGNAVLMAATGMGGALGYGHDAPDFAAAHGGVLGFVKCMANEWPDVIVRAIDLDMLRPVGENAVILLDELRDPDGPVEIGCNGERRLTWEPVSATFPSTADPLLRIDSSSVILVTGGARGITAEIAKELAERFRPTLILVGRSALPGVEDELTRGLSTPAEIKKALIARDTNSQQRPDARRIEHAFQEITRDREIRENLAAIQQAGSVVEYHATDVRDDDAIAKLVRHILEKHQRIDGVIHGAGVIDDKLVRDKTVPSFERVFGTKVDSASHLLRHLPLENLQFMALFASIASRFGNRGQSDYAAANELLSKLAVELDRRLPGRVFSVAWGPWSDVGMVADLAPHLAARGITLIPPSVGASLFVDELLYGCKGDSEIIIAGGAENLVTAAKSRASQ